MKKQFFTAALAAMLAVSAALLSFAGDLPTLSGKDLENGYDGAGAGRDWGSAEKTAGRINETDAQVNKNSGAIEKNAAEIEKTNKAAEQNSSDISATQAAIGDDEFRKKSVQQRLEEINKRFGQSGVGEAYVRDSAEKTLKAANDYTDSRYNQLNSKVNKLRARADSGIAGATAIGTLTFDILKPHSLSGGFTAAKNKIAGAAGYRHNFDANWRARGTVAVSDNYVQGGASIGYSW